MTLRVIGTCFGIAAILAAVGVMVSLVRRTTGIPGVGVGRMVLLYGVVAGISATVLLAGLRVLPRRKRWSALLLGWVIGLIVGLALGVLIPEPGAAPRSLYLTAVIFATGCGLPGGWILFNVFARPGSGVQ